VHRSTTAIILNITYGYTLAERDDPYVALADAAVQTLSQAGVFGTYLVDYIPVLKYVPPWMPGASFKRQAREWRRLSREMLDSPFKIVKQNTVRLVTIYTYILIFIRLQVKGTAVSCITTKQLDKLKDSGGSIDEEELMKNVSAIAYGGKVMFMTNTRTKLCFMTGGADTVRQNERY
jgi:hypothetical protein